MVKQQDLPIALDELVQDGSNAMLLLSRNRRCVSCRCRQRGGDAFAPRDQEAQATADGPLVVAELVVCDSDKPGADILGKLAPLIQPYERLLRQVRREIRVSREPREVLEQGWEAIGEKAGKAGLKAGRARPPRRDWSQRQCNLGTQSKCWHIGGTPSGRGK